MSELIELYARYYNLSIEEAATALFMLGAVPPQTTVTDVPLEG